jgi:hypothetical protein
LGAFAQAEDEQETISNVDTSTDTTDTTTDTSTTDTTTTDTTTDTTTTDTTTTDNTPNSTNPIGNYKFVYTSGTDTYTDEYTIDTNSGLENENGDDIYNGFDVDTYLDASIVYDTTSTSGFVLVSTLSDFVRWYYFTIGSDNSISGCYYIYWETLDYFTSCISFDNGSKAYPAGEWQKPALDTIDLNDDYYDGLKKRIDEIKMLSSEH